MALLSVITTTNAIAQSPPDKRIKELRHQIKLDHKRIAKARHRIALRKQQIQYWTRIQREAALSPVAAIIYVFGRIASQAIAVATCESGLRTDAQNGQYLGLFQMGANERRIFGYGPTAIEQSRGAYRYYQVAGWGPWECKP